MPIPLNSRDGINGARPQENSHESALLEQFLALSGYLVGEMKLPSDLGAAYLQRIREVGMDASSALDDMMAKFVEILSIGGDIPNGIRQQIFGDPRLRRTARRVIVLWILAELIDDQDRTLPGPPEHYFRALMPDFIQAHPLGLSGGYFGYWKYPPEN